MAKLPIAEQLRLRRELRTEIARHRRRIDTSINRLKHESRQLVSWRTHVARNPLAGLAGAFGVGMALSAGLPRGSWLRPLTGWAVRAAFANLPASVLRDLTTWLLGNAASPESHEST